MIKKILIGIVCLAVVLVTGLCAGLYFMQERLIFHPNKLAADYKFTYEAPFEEITITAKDGKLLHGLLFKADSSKGLVFYLHGNAGALDTWGDMASTYTATGYDLLILDYRGFGKSEGEISSEEQFHSDIQAAYDLMKKRYAENKIVVAGYSIGTAPAAALAAANHPKLLILQAPYYSLGEMGKQQYPLAPGFLLRYKFETFKGVQNTKAPVIIFHGDSDKLIPLSASQKLQQHFKTGDRLVTLPRQGHGGMNDNEVYKEELAQLLR